MAVARAAGESPESTSAQHAQHAPIVHLADALPPPSLFALLADADVALSPHASERLRHRSLAADAARSLRSVVAALAHDEWADDGSAGGAPTAQPAGTELHAL